jgi:para-aminobenzoate synthetase/4-amino-4-deoxychorismate lyase
MPITAPATSTSPVAPNVSALVDFANPRDPSGLRLRHAFGAARQVLVAYRPDEVRPLLDAVQTAALGGAWCVGYLRYEAAPAFDTALTVHAPDGPLAWFAVYDAALPWPEPGSNANTISTSQSDVSSAGSSATVEVQWQNVMPRPAFDAALAQIDRDITAGAFYQVNFTAQMHGTVTNASTHTPALPLFHALQRAQPSGYAAYLDTGTEQVLSVSPELFFDWQGGTILTRPMKGTAPRGSTPADDTAQEQTLRTSIKERAENVMIVDLLRNDLSRIAEPFSVRVPRLFHTEALPSVWQMTSDIEARTRAGCSLADVFAALFPCGSVTGAPKVQAMRAIHALEGAPRGVYCGALGVVQPGGHATFNVLIRTVTLRGTAARCGIGSGITSGSTADGEWSEWQLKQAFVQRASVSFSLLETLRLFDGHLRDLQAHLTRMEHAARHFAYPWNAQPVQDTLQRVTQQHPQGAWRVRLLLDAQGRPTAQAYPLPASPSRVRLQLADRPLEAAHGEFVRFKTTHRAHYDAFTPQDTPAQAAAFDTVLWNAEGEVTECTRGNIALLLDGRWVTPPLASGLLGGVGRARAIAEGRMTEAVVRVDDLHQVQAVAFVNSLRGWIDADLSL